MRLSDGWQVLTWMSCDAMTGLAAGAAAGAGAIAPGEAIAAGDAIAGAVVAVCACEGADAAAMRNVVNNTGAEARCRNMRISSSE
jgi:hypothetical protein